MIAMTNDLQFYVDPINKTICGSIIGNTPVPYRFVGAAIVGMPFEFTLANGKKFRTAAPLVMVRN